jgi:DNA-binding XRE family transcriptional regulator
MRGDGYMCVSPLIDEESALGLWVRSLRLYLNLTQQELAGLAKVTPEEIDLLEHNKPLLPDAKLRIMKELCTRRLINWSRLANC